MCGGIAVAIVAGGGSAGGVHAQEAPLTVHEAVELALDRHPEVQVARALRDGAAAEVGEARGAWWPSLSVQGTLTRFQEPMLVAPLHGFDLSTAPPFDRTLIRGGVHAGWTLFEGGARGARVDRTAAGEAAAETDLRSSEMRLTTEVVVTYLRVLTLKGVLAAEDLRLESLRAERERVDRLLTEGEAPEVELYRAEASIARAEADRVETAARLEAEQRQLERLADLEPFAVTAERLAPVELARPRLEESREALLDRAVAANPGVASARHQAEAAEADRGLAKAEWFPSLEVFGDLLTYGSQEGRFDTEWQAGIGLRYPLFVGGARAKRVERATALRNSAEQAARRAELAVAGEADRALATVRATEAQSEAYTAAVAHLQEVVRVERLALDQGAGVQTDFLQAEAELLEARAARLEAHNLNVAARVELARVLGDLTPAWLAENLENGR